MRLKKVETMKLYCKRCNELLTPKTLIKADEDELRFEEGEELLPKDKYVLNDDIWNFDKLETSYLINIKSIILKDHEDKSRMVGCCGPSGLDGFNQLCPNCNEEVGILVADCFTLHFVGIDVNKVSLKPMW